MGHQSRVSKGKFKVKWLSDSFTPLSGNLRNKSQEFFPPPDQCQRGGRVTRETVSRRPPVQTSVPAYMQPVKVWATQWIPPAFYLQRVISLLCKISQIAYRGCSFWFTFLKKKSVRVNKNSGILSHPCRLKTCFFFSRLLLSFFFVLFCFHLRMAMMWR